MGVLEKIANKIGNNNKKAIDMVREKVIKKLKENIEYFEIRKEELFDD